MHVSDNENPLYEEFKCTIWCCEPLCNVGEFRFMLFVLLFQPGSPIPVDLVAAVNECAVTGNGFLCPEYSYQLCLNPWQHPAFDNRANLLLGVIVALCNTCGGFVRFTYDQGVPDLTEETREMFNSRLLELVQEKTNIISAERLMRLTLHLDPVDSTWAILAVKKAENRHRCGALQLDCDIYGDTHIHNQSSTDTGTCSEDPSIGTGQELSLHASGPDAVHTAESPTTRTNPDTDGASTEGVVSEPEDAPVVFACFQKLNWTEHKKDWHRYVNVKEQTLDDIVKSCPVWQPTAPMHITPDRATLESMFKSKNELEATLSKIDNGGSGFAIASRKWSTILPFGNCCVPPRNHICDILTISVLEKWQRICLWEIVDSTDEGTVRNQLEYVMKLGRVIKFHLMKQNNGCPNICVECNLYAPSGAVDESQQVRAILNTSAELQNIVSDFCHENGKFESLQKAIVFTMLFKESSMKCCIGDQLSVVLSDQQAQALLQQVQVNYICGPAGSGKSLIALHVYKSHGSEESVYICTTLPFVRFLEFNGCEGSLIQNDEQMLDHIRKGTFKDKTCVIIDDSHNLKCSKRSLKKLFQLLKRRREMCLFVFADNEYQSFDRKRQQAIYDVMHDLTRDVLQQTMRSEHLTEIYRNTRKVVSFVQSAIAGATATCQKVTCANTMSGEGVECIKMERIWANTTKNDLVKYLHSEHRDEKYRPTEIAVLLENEYSTFLVYHCRDILRQQLPAVTFHTASEFPRTGIVVDNVESFLGLDASVCIFILATDSTPKLRPKRGLASLFRRQDKGFHPTIANPHYRVFLASRATQKAVFAVPEIDEDLVLQMKFDHFQVT